MPVSHIVSLVVLIGFCVWEAYAQAKGIPFEMRAWILGVIMVPFGQSAYGWVKKLPGLFKKK